MIPTIRLLPYERYLYVSWLCASLFACLMRLGQDRRNGALLID
jgi:hypothetical protein